MNENETYDEPMRTVMRHWRCPCGGEMIFTGFGFAAGFSSTNDHQCNKCGQKKSADRTYPCIEFVRSHDN